MNDVWYAVIIFIVFFVGAALVGRVLGKLAKHFDANSSEIFRIISNSQKAILVFIGTVLALDKLGFDVSALVAGLGLTGFAMGLALKDAISNLVAGVLTVLYKTVELEDVIEVSGTQGAVIDINLRYVTVQTGDKIHLIPNSLFLNNKLSIIEKKA
jgi:small-conductance mechanosensitive channel